MSVLARVRTTLVPIVLVALAVLAQPTRARADLRFLAPWACDGAEVSDAERAEYFEALQSAAFTMLDENGALIDTRLEVYGRELRVDPTTGALIHDGVEGPEDVTGLVRADLVALRAASAVAALEAALVDDLEDAHDQAELAQYQIFNVRRWGQGSAGRTRELAERDIRRHLSWIRDLGFVFVGDREGRLVDLESYEDRVRRAERGDYLGDPAALSEVDVDHGQYLLHEADLDAFLDCTGSEEAIAHNRFAQIADVVETDLLAARQRELGVRWPINEAPAGARERPLEDQLFGVDASDPADLRAFALLLGDALRHTRDNIADSRARIADMDVDDAHELAGSAGVAAMAYDPRFDDVACVVRSEIHINWRTLLRVGTVVLGIAATFVNPVLGVILATAAAGGSVAEAALLFREARRARAEWNTGYDRSSLHAEAIHRQIYVQAYLALGGAFLEGAIALQQLRLFSSALARAPPAVQADELAIVAARGDDAFAVAARVRRGRRVGLPCGAKLDGATPRCVPVPAHAIGNLGDGHRAHNLAVLDDYEPGAAFSGVFHVDTGKVLIRPSGSTTLRTGEAAPGAVSQFGGHGTLASELEELTGVPYARNVGFVAFYDEAGEVSVKWNSASVNSANWGNRAAPTEHRQPAMDAIAEALGVTVTSR